MRYTLITTRRFKMPVIVERVPVMFRWMARQDTPLQVLLANLVFDNVFHKPRAEQAVDLALVEREVVCRRLAVHHGVVEDGLLIGLAPAMRPHVVHAFGVHSRRKDCG